ncbi:efflux RND transporter periplasmic adaptor subunit [Clostridium sp. CCUG 7971]|uniref:efflux RND transporter periplasmic adaptor subunit n=1 Tax=Clostridium sp. CCUG 7971 TaxID=2811414 RepID=UPI001ABA750E|nr:efflux RND transporter periplasmic adaptor subunit [Clostridium sp. CCUG 7971]MBO3444290.1 efflux RND transporter periplasmic adaptor subunit [Clostridium sp. CCUG 7971]
MLAKKKLIALIVGVCVVGGAIVLMVKPKNEEPVKKDKEHTVVVDDIRVSIEGGGEAKLEGVDHKFETNGSIEKIYVNKGDKVKKGTTLAKLSDEDINLQIEESKIEQNIKSETLNQLKNQKKNLPEDLSLDSQIKLAQGELDKINQKIKKLKSDLNKLYIYAKNNGIVLDIKGELGASVTPSNPVVVIGKEEKIYLDVLLSQTDIIGVKENQEVKVTFETYPDIEVNGIVKEKSYISSAQGEDVNYKVIAELDTKELEIYQGMTAEIEFLIKNKENVIQVPNKAITMKDNKQIVKVKENDKIKEVEVKTGFSDGKVTEILEGLQEGQVVIEERQVGGFEGSRAN